jgi:ERCC4-type nuclease
MEQLDVAVMILEGRLQWSRDGYLLDVRGFSQEQWVGVTLSICNSGLWLLQTTDLHSTVLTLKQLETWLNKLHHGGLRTRPKAQGEWGKASSREWGIYFWQSFDGVGAGLAERLYDRVGIPLEWTINEADLQAIPGIGFHKAEKILRSINDPFTSGNSNGSSSDYSDLSDS